MPQAVLLEAINLPYSYQGSVSAYIIGYPFYKNNYYEVSSRFGDFLQENIDYFKPPTEAQLKAIVEKEAEEAKQRAVRQAQFSANIAAAMASSLFKDFTF